jgi:hypothetical protein
MLPLTHILHYHVRVQIPKNCRVYFKIVFIVHTQVHFMASTACAHKLFHALGVSSANLFPGNEVPSLSPSALLIWVTYAFYLNKGLRMQ